MRWGGSGGRGGKGKKREGPCLVKRKRLERRRLGARRPRLHETQPDPPQPLNPPPPTHTHKRPLAGNVYCLRADTGALVWNRTIRGYLTELNATLTGEA